MTRFGYVFATAMLAELFALLFLLVAWIAPQPRLLWNASASAPIGLYRIHPGEPPHVGDLAAVMPPPTLAQLLAERRYLPLGLPLLKHVAGRPGDTLCRRGSVVTVNGTRAAVARDRDSHGRPLSEWHGCHVLQRGELFLLNAAADSFDGRYFGPIPASGLIGRATPILTRDAPGAPLRWRGLRGASASPSPTPQPTKGPVSCK